MASITHHEVLNLLLNMVSNEAKILQPYTCTQEVVKEPPIPAILHV